MNYTMIILRLFHILSGVAWAGGAFLLPLFLEPTVKATGPDGAKFMGHLTRQTKFSLYMSLAALFVVLSGWSMIYIKSNFAWFWFQSGEGLFLGIGAVLGTIAFLVGFMISRTAAEKMGKVAGEIQQGGGKPTPEQAALMQKAQEQLSLGGKLTAVLLMLTIICMAVASYIPVA